ncbi:MAG: DUF1295 domain-containing protein [Planctomycetota bacterium]|nr:DUF1295 domain-containing protein [Planctomycetota bacterium]MEC8510688.1 DUF1295 domain-containing protein [Planctomycetota bacterium]
MFDPSSGLIALLAVGLLMTSVWAIHLRDEDASIVDPVWGASIWTAGLVHSLGVGAELRGGRLIALVLAAAWALRLGAYLHIRHGIVGEDRRYRKMREARGDAWWWQSLPVVFLLQAILAWVVALPLMALGSGPTRVGWLTAAGFLVALCGFLFESIADGQLARYRRLSSSSAVPDGRSGVMDQGLWGLSRHPNYFGEAVFWWGLGLAAIGVGAWWALAGPVLITFMLLKVSGVTMTEADIAERRPAYRDYVKRVNAFVPGPRREG